MDTIILGRQKESSRIQMYIKSYKCNQKIKCVADINKMDGIACKGEDYLILPFDDKINYHFDQIIIATLSDDEGYKTKRYLKELGVLDDKIIIASDDKELKGVMDCSGSKYAETDRRVKWLYKVSKEINEKEITGSVCECGVNEGDFAYYLNRCFDTRSLLLFDTFEGFKEEDLIVEREISDDRFINGHFNSGKVFGGLYDKKIELVMKKMSNPDNVKVYKGYFPQSAEGISEKFAFVNLDMDLYKPTYEGLFFFWPLLSEGGVILCHDYYHPELPGVKKAVDEFAEETKIANLEEVGDDCSIAIKKV